MCPSCFADQLVAEEGQPRFTRQSVCASCGGVSDCCRMSATCRSGVGGHSLEQRLKVRRAKTETLPLDV